MHPPPSHSQPHVEPGRRRPRAAGSRADDGQHAVSPPAAERRAADRSVGGAAGRRSGRSTLSERDARHEGRCHWASWALRGLLVVILVFQLARGNLGGALVAAEGIAVSLLPLLVSRLSGWHVPRLLDVTFVLAMALQFGSESLKLFELFTYWDKLVHPAEIFLASGIATFLLLGYRRFHRLEIPDGLAAAGAMLFGMSLGAFWELVEFGLDWFGNTSLQKSNADSMTDILLNDAGAIFGTLLAFWLYRHWAPDHVRDEFGEIAEWSTAWLARLLRHHGRAVGIGVALVLAAIVFAGWSIDRVPVPPPTGQPPAGWPPGAPRRWRFTSPGPGGPTAVVLGEWTADQHGTCRAPVGRVWPGGEQVGLLALDPGVDYGPRVPFTAATHTLAERPPLFSGTAMDTGLVFGLRGPGDYYVLRSSTLHDTVSLDRYLHGQKRNLREEQVLMRGNEWHELRVEVMDGQVTALLDGRVLFYETGLTDLDGGLGLWARVTTAGCFADAVVQPLVAGGATRAWRTP